MENYSSTLSQSFCYQVSRSIMNVTSRYQEGNPIVIKVRVLTWKWRHDTKMAAVVMSFQVGGTSKRIYLCKLRSNYVLIKLAVNFNSSLKGKVSWTNDVTRRKKHPKILQVPIPKLKCVATTPKVDPSQSTLNPK